MNLDGALVLSVNISAGQTVQYRGNWLTTGIFKTPVEGPVMLADTRLRGDVQADLKVHGGFERAAYAYAEEDYLWWQGRLGKTLPFGKFGENFTLRGIDISSALIGERWQIGRAVVQVTSPRIPCFKLGITMQDPKFVKRFAEALRPGAYLRIIQEGEVAAGDPVDLVWKPDHEVTVKEMTRIYMYERDKLGEILVPELPQDWREWVLAETGT